MKINSFSAKIASTISLATLSGSNNANNGKVNPLIKAVFVLFGFIVVVFMNE
jgi:hypothetical protein